MTYDQFLQTVERIGVPFAIILAALFFLIRYMWPFITAQAWPFITGLIENFRSERIEERDKFLAAINRLVDERDEERAAFIKSLQDRDEKIASVRESFLEHLRQRDQEFRPVIETLKSIVDTLADLRSLADERTSALSVSMANIQGQLEAIRRSRNNGVVSGQPGKLQKTKAKEKG